MSFQVLTFRSGKRDVEYIETTCAGKCMKLYRIDENHPDYKRVREALERGDRSVLFCYHNHDLPLPPPPISPLN